MKYSLKGKAKELQSEVAYRKIKLAILNGEFAPGMLLMEQELIEYFELGRTPIREGIQRLIMEDLVYRIPRKGIFVTPISSDDARDLYELRCKLDPFAAELAAQRATKQDVDAMVALIENFKDFAEDEKALFDERVHGLLYKATYNVELTKILKRLYQQSVRLSSLKGFKRETLENMYSEWNVIIDAVRKKNPEKAAEASLIHLKSRDWF